MSISAATGKRIRDLRTDAGLAPVLLAKQAGVRVHHLLEIEEGRVRPSLATLHELARGLDTTVEQLVREAGEVRRQGGASGGSPGRRLEWIARAIADLPDGIGDKLEAVENAVVRHAMLACGGNKSAAARLIGVQRKALERRRDRIRRAAAGREKGLAL